MTFTHFWDMHSGGDLKEQWQHIFIEADEETAREIFYKKFRHYPDNITCDCCGEDYSVSVSETLEQATGFFRGCKRADNGYIEEESDKPGFSFQRKYRTLAEYLKQERDNVLVIYATEAK